MLSERTLCELPNQTQVSSTISVVFGGKDRSHHENLPNREKRGVKSLTEHSRGMTRAGPVYHVAATKTCPQTMSTSCVCSERGKTILIGHTKQGPEFINPKSHLGVTYTDIERLKETSKDRI